MTEASIYAADLFIILGSLVAALCLSVLKRKEGP